MGEWNFFHLFLVPGKKNHQENIRRDVVKCMTFRTVKLTTTEWVFLSNWLNKLQYLGPILISVMLTGSVLHAARHWPNTILAIPWWILRSPSYCLGLHCTSCSDSRHKNKRKALLEEGSSLLKVQQPVIPVLAGGKLQPSCQSRQGGLI